jgi:YesN/AraC family two-component response regulator
MVTEQALASFSLLFVEDDSMICMAIGRMIAMQFPDVTVYTAENGQIGLELFKEHTPDIVITDINMPIMDGIQMAREIKSIKTNTKFIVVTGYSNKNYLEKFSEIGFDDYIVKPVDFKKLFATIERCRAEIPL